MFDPLLVEKSLYREVDVIPRGVVIVVGNHDCCYGGGTGHLVPTQTNKKKRAKTHGIPRKNVLMMVILWVSRFVKNGVGDTGFEPVTSTV